MKRDVTTVQRWEKREGMPVHRHVHDKLGSVYAFKAELDAWARDRSPAQATEPEVETPERPPRGRRAWLAIAAGVAALAIGITLGLLQNRDPRADNPLADAHFSPLTDFDGIEQAAAVSRDGKFVAFLSDRDGQMDVWVTQVGVGQFYNLTRGGVAELVNPSVRTLGFSPDGTLVTFWARHPESLTPNVRAVPVLGGQPRAYLDGAEFDWSADAKRLVYHTPGPGDPMYVREFGETSQARQIFSAPAGLHSHFLVWSPDQRFIYFVQGSVPDRMDIWRIPPTGGTAERMTKHDSRVSHPVFVNARSLLYLASEADGSGPWIYSIDVERRISQRASVGIDRYTSLAASGDGHRIVATVASPKSTLWRLPIASGRAAIASGTRVPLTTSNGTLPRIGPGYLLYVSSKGTGDSIWTLRGDMAAEVWSAADARIVGGPVIARDGRSIAFTVRQRGETTLHVANVDGAAARLVMTSLALQGAPAWTPDGQSITIAGIVDGVPRLFTIPLDGGSPVPLVREYSIDPVWSPDGEFVVFSGPDIGTTFEVKAVKADGSPYQLPKLTLTRGARHLSVIDGRRLLVLRGEIQHKDLWSIDLQTGAEQQLTGLAPDFAVRDFDVSGDGREVILEQAQEQSDIVLLDVPSR